MPTWFTVERLDPSTFAISEYQHWEEVHCYLLLGRDRALLIDTGLGVGDLKAVTDRLTDLPILVVTTHVHWDHIGGHWHYPDFAVHGAEADWLNGSFPLPLSVIKHNLADRPCPFPPGFSPADYRIFQGAPRFLLRDGDRLDLGGRSVTVVHTPGHSPGHCCFYEPTRRYLFSGDLIYSGTLDAFYPTTDPQLFRQSIQRVQALDVERILPGHHSLELPVGIIDDIERAFRSLAEAGKLTQGAGLFDFGSFRIHI